MFLNRLKPRAAAHDAPSPAADPVAPAADDVAALAPVVGTLLCSEPGCRSERAVTCAYEDRRGRHCETARCAAHLRMVGEQAFCLRHGGVMAAISGLPPDERQVPDIDNRAPSLCQWVAADLDGAVQTMLYSARGARGDLDVVADHLVPAMAGTPRVRGWERVWKLMDNAGVHVKVTLRVAEEHDNVVVAKVNGKVVAEVIPPWISEGPPVDPASDGRRRQDFRDHLLQAIATAVAASAVL